MLGINTCTNDLISHFQEILLQQYLKRKPKTQHPQPPSPRTTTDIFSFQALPGITFAKRICTAATSASPNTSYAQQQVITRIKQNRAGNALPQLSLQQAIELYEHLTLVTHTQLFTRLPRDYLVVRTTRAHHPQLRPLFLSWRTHPSPPLSKHYPNKRALSESNFAFGQLIPRSSLQVSSESSCNKMSR